MDARRAAADEVAELLADDPAVLERLRAAYTGSDDVMDAVAWRRSGAAGPAELDERITALRRIVHSRAPEPGAAERLAPLERELAARTVAVDAAVDAALADAAARAEARRSREAAGITAADQATFS